MSPEEREEKLIEALQILRARLQEALFNGGPHQEAIIAVEFINRTLENISGAQRAWKEENGDENENQLELIPEVTPKSHFCLTCFRLTPMTGHNCSGMPMFWTTRT